MDNVVSTSNWSNFCWLSRRAGSSAIAGLPCVNCYGSRSSQSSIYLYCTICCW